MSAKATSIRCEDLECCKGLQTSCHLEIRSDAADEAIRLMQAHVQSAHKTNYTAAQLRPLMKEAA